MIITKSAAEFLNAPRLRERSSNKATSIMQTPAADGPAGSMNGPDCTPPLPPPGEPPAAPNPPRKSATVLKLLGRAKGATIAEIEEPTGWQPHSTRAYLSRLRKKGLTVIREQRRTGETTYRIVDAASAKVDAPVGQAADTISPAASTGTQVDGLSAGSGDDFGVLTLASPDAGSKPEATA